MKPRLAVCRTCYDCSTAPGARIRHMSSVVCSLAGGSVGSTSDGSWKALSAGPQERLAILRRYRRVAMVGVSANPLRPSHFVAVYLANRGYDIVPVNPRAKTVLERPSFPNLSAIPEPVDVVDIFRPPQFVPALVEEAIEIGAKVVWMQFDIVHEEAARRAREAGLEVVMDQCMKVEHARFFGGLSALGLNGGVVSARSWAPKEGSHGLR